ncbi:50S ribosomal protein L5 [Campylobacter vulpis]|uniref:Large ribosomal subunit protein uL5 n=1 Tax=Campylobacter vulpis TaxID=1655500 RepID=A0A2G4R321_9BACT|nr:50S ribosomal protein L5 [Campylobacter vulpis]MBS4235862.1 50S ribosomal protein L5 [Campylobacter vulpis]MBS4241341.1 50S ribosomal protein L5 [Campylobacter vulpis]MBS4252994.1 50S ribosomal protein L5 [Campylobacter vulpis]MBS4269437.1 50S ribosomal protein L5 [Campylobacter vulpis]MBS4275816.1 50S ribosomal protein L5 [Campylobacter vulpis]
MRLKEKYSQDIKAALIKEFDIKNPMLVPALEKVVISVGAGELAKDQKVLQNVADTISLIAGQRAVITKAKKSVAGFKVREGFPVGVMVTLRKDNMFAFLDKLISIALPRVKDFRGLSRDGFDGRGNYNFGLNEQLMFPEVEYDKILRTHGMNISIVTTAQNDKEALKLLELFGVPFAKGK